MKKDWQIVDTLELPELENQTNRYTNIKNCNKGVLDVQIPNDFKLISTYQTLDKITRNRLLKSLFQ